MRPALLVTLAAVVSAATAARAQTAPAPGPAPSPTAPAPAQPPPIEAVDFDEAVRRAVAHAPSAQLAAEDVRRVEALLWEVRSGALPFVSANGTYTRIDHERTTTATVPNGTGGVRSIDIRTVPEQQNNGNLSASVPLFAPSRWYQWSHAGDQVDVSRASERDVRRVVSLTAARAYLTIIAQKRSIEVSRRAVQTAAAHYDYAHTRRLGGVGNALDEARADQQLATAQAQLESALAGLVRAQEALGIATGTDGPLDAKGEPDLGGGPASPDEGVASAEQSRTDVLVSRQRYRAAHRVARDSWSDWLPTLTLNGQAYHQTPPSSTTPRDGWQLQLVLSLPLFDGGLRIGQAQERGALEAQARTQLDAALLQARSDVRTAFQNLQHADASLAANRRAAQQANAALGIVQQAFKAGATTSLDVTDAERTARDADSAAVVAEDGVRQARLDLLAATGKFPAPAPASP